MQNQPEVIIRGVDWHQWAEEPQTQQFLVWLRQSVAASQAAWLAGEYTSHEANIAAQAVAQGFARVLFTLENIELGVKDDSEK